MNSSDTYSYKERNSLLLMDKKQLLLLEKQFNKCIKELDKLTKMKGFSEFDDRTTDGLIKLEDRLCEEITLLQKYKPYLKEPLAKDVFTCPK